MFKTSAFHLTGGRSHAPHVVDNALSLSLSLSLSILMFMELVDLGSDIFDYLKYRRD
jgi:hypothetical protein